MEHLVKIGLLMNFRHEYELRMCEAFASVALARGWELSLFSPDDVVRGAAKADAFIARGLNAETTAALKATGKPVVSALHF